MLQFLLRIYGLDPDLCHIEPFGTGLINHTWKVACGEQAFILQRINKHIFTKPQSIADNIQLLANYLDKIAPDYIFAAPIAAVNGKHLIELDGEYFRMSPFVPDSHTVDFLIRSEQAYQAAQKFGEFTSLLQHFDAGKLNYTLSDFHNLTLRISNFFEALKKADPGKKHLAESEIKQVEAQLAIAEEYEKIVKGREIPLRVIHHDTKISNVLFNSSEKGIAVIDLDTVMPGYYISDVGDMMRTYLAKANEEEKDLNEISIRDDFFAAIYAGYMSKMGDVLTPREKELFIFSGKFMIYMQAVRFLTDFLNGDIYYKARYEGHNLMRAKNQLRLLALYIEAEPSFGKIIRSIGTATV